MTVGNLKVAADIAAGEWSAAGVHDRGLVSGLIPGVFPAYARVFHPAYREADSIEESEERTPTSAELIPGTNMARTVWQREVRWAEVAKANQRLAHPAMEWASITGHHRFRWNGNQPGIWDIGPSMGTLSLSQTERLCDVLAAFTRTPDRCWCAIWEGYADLPSSLRDADVPRLAMPGRDMILLSGALSDVPAASFHDWWYDAGSDNDANWYRSPSLWWPEDRAWCIASDTDLMSSYLGASAECVRCLVDDSHLEVLPVRENQRVGMDADAINPEPLGEYGG